MRIERALPEDHEALTAITKKSKAFWNYSKQQMEDWDSLLTITPGYLLDNETYKLVSGNVIIGYYSLQVINKDTLKLDNLFVLPEFISKGLGRKLMEAALENASQNNYATIILDSDPNSEDFYSHFGFVKIGQIETSVKDRFLPIMKRIL